MINIKENIWIQGFNDEEKFRRKESDYTSQNTLYFLNRELIWSGKTSDIPEDVAKKCVKNHWNFTHKFHDYSNQSYVFETALESIKSALTKSNGDIYNHCIIFKIN